MFTSKAIGINLLLLLATLPSLGQQAPRPPAPKTDTPESGAITGKVVDERNQPMTNASVYVYAIGSSGLTQTTSTDREGTFQVKGLDRGDYGVAASAPSYLNPPTDPGTTRPPTYHPGDSVTLTLIKGGVVTGTITNAAGEPVVAVGVRAQMIRDANGRRVTEGFNVQKWTDDRGIYRLYGLPTGTYVVMAGGPNNSSFVVVNAFELDAPIYAPSSTRDSAAAISVRAGEETAGIDIRYRSEPGRVVSGQVNSPPDFRDFSVELTTAEDAEVFWSSRQSQQVQGSREFAFTGVGEGDYILVAQAHAENGDRSISTVKRIKVRGADVTGIELVTRPLSSVAGRVVLAETKAPECADKPRLALNEMSISAWHNDNGAAKQMPRYVWAWGAPVLPDAQGNFKLHSLAPGEYYFAAAVRAKYWYLQSFAFEPTPAAGAKTPAKPVDATRVWTNVKAGDKLSGLAVTVAQGAASLHGKLSLGEGEEVPKRLFVFLVPAEREKVDEVLRYYGVPVAADGKVLLNNLAPGHYWVFAQTIPEDAGSPVTKLRLPDATEARARFRRDAEAARTDIELKPCQDVTNFQFPLKSVSQ